LQQGVVNFGAATGQFERACVVDGVQAAVSQQAMNFSLFGFQAGNALRQIVKLALFFEAELAGTGSDGRRCGADCGCSRFARGDFIMISLTKVIL
jgi:hypothetical protein